MVVEAGRLRLAAVLIAPPAGQCDQAQRSTSGAAQLPRDLVAAEARESEIEQHDLRLEFLGAAEGGLAGVRNARRVAGKSKQHGHRLGGVGVVVDNKDAQRLGCGGAGAARTGSWVVAVIRPAGRDTVKRLPVPTPSLAAVSVPPCIATMRRASVRPSPSPPAAATLACLWAHAAPPLAVPRACGVSCTCNVTIMLGEVIE
jgi:hypothetical protein